MTITVEAKKSEGAERLLQVTVPANAVNEAKEKAARKIATSVTLPGFRAGKAPLGMVMKRFGDAIRAEQNGFGLRGIDDDADDDVGAFGRLGRRQSKRTRVSMKAPQGRQRAGKLRRNLIRPPTCASIGLGFFLFSAMHDYFPR